MNQTVRTSLVFILLWCAPALAQNHTSLIDRVFAGDTSVAGRAMVQPSVLSNPDDIHWDTRFGIPGANAEVRTIAVAGDWVYVGGDFTYVGNVYANRIARWNRRTLEWQALGDGPSNGVDGVVFAIAVKGDSVIVGGQFLQAGGITAANIAIWSAQSRAWSTVGQGGSGDLDAYVSAIVIKGDGFYVGGRFSAMGTLIANNVAHWDGTRWRRLDAGVNQPVYSMLVKGEDLYVGGEFTVAGTGAVSRVARWDGEKWNGMGAGFNGTVNSLAVMNDTLYAGGTFGQSGTESMHLIAWWDAGGGAWKKLNAPEAITYPDIVYSLATHHDSLFVVGKFIIDDAWNIMIWSHGNWHKLHSADSITRTLGQVPRGFPPIPEPSEIYAVASDGEQLYMGGTFPYSTYSLGTIPHPARCLVAWNVLKQRWVVMGRGVNDIVNTLLAGDDGIYAGGKFISAGGKAALKIARWEGGAWEALGDGLHPQEYIDNGAVNALTAYDKKIYAVGEFGRRGDPSEDVYWRDVSNVAAWDGSGWNHLPIVKMNGDGRSIAPVEAVVSFRGALYAGRNDKVMRWADTVWTSTGIPQLPVVGIYTLVNDKDQHIYAGTRNGVYGWDGIASAWTMIGATDDSVIAIAVDGSRLFAGGRFMKVGDMPANRIAMYDIIGGTWSTLGPGVDRFDVRRPPSVNALAVSNGLLYVGGLFSRAGDVTVGNIATWDGETWSPLGSGTDSVVKAIAIAGDDLYLGGGFKVVGGSIPSWFFAHWNAHATAAVAAGKHERKGMTLRAEPNPASDRVELRYTIPSGGRVRISVHDMLGREVGMILEENTSAGEHSVSFNAGELPAGIYYCRLEGMGSITTTQLVLVR
jgi:hypothetical protein